MTDPQHVRAVCINCAHAFRKNDVRCFYGLAASKPSDEVGPFCETCYATIKRHEERRLRPSDSGLPPSVEALHQIKGRE